MAQPRHVFIDKSTHDMYRSLTEGKSSPFETMRDAFMTAAILGFKSGTRLPLERRQEIFQWSVLNTQEDIPVLQAIAITVTGRADIVGFPDEVLEIAQEYANAGITLLHSILLEHHGLPTNNLVNLLLEEMCSEDSASGLTANRPGEITPDGV